MGLPKCEHGVARGDGRYVGVWAAPFSECGCCGVSFPYIDAAWGGPDGSGGRSWTKDRCEACGGHYVEWGKQPDPPRPAESGFADWDHRLRAGAAPEARP